MSYLITVITGYLLGSISSSYLAGKWIKGIDIREHGSGNAGATNTLRVLGPRTAFIVLFTDALKGVISVWIAYMITGTPEGMALAGLASIAGHNWPIFFGFRGGKGIATTIGVIFSLALIPAILAGIFAILLLIVTRMVSLSSLAFISLLPITLIVMNRPIAYVLLAFGMMVMAYWRHRGNIRRILRGEEQRFGKKRF